MVSGASRGIGRAVTERLLNAGFRVSAGLRQLRALVATDRLMTYRYDAESIESARDWVDATVSRFGALHGLVNVAGLNTKVELTDPEEAQLDALWTVNVKAPRRLTRFALPHLRACSQGRVVNVASLSGKRVRNSNVGYAMSKFALVALTHGVRQAGWQDGVRASALCPDPRDLAMLVETILQLSNTASIAELLANCQQEDML
jgi:NAD(P)-dependent dehydrogenase (short-subunit alcohol dehydrogenase family)